MADQVGVALSTYQNLEAAKTTRIEVEALAALVSLGMDLEPLLGPQAPKSPQLGPADLPPERAEDYVWIPRYDVRASGGHGALVQDESVMDRLAFKRSWVIGEKGLDPNKLALVSVEGDSMSPTLESGDLILVNTVQTAIHGGGLYLIRVADVLMAKRLQRVGPDEVMVISDNKATYPAFTTKVADGLAVIGEIVWFCRDLK